MVGVASWESVARGIPSSGVATVAIGFVLDRPTPTDESWRGSGTTDLGTRRTVVTERLVPPFIANRNWAGRLIAHRQRTFMFEAGTMSQRRGESWVVRQRLPGGPHPRDPCWLLSGLDEFTLERSEETEVRGEPVVEWRGHIPGRTWPVDHLDGRVRVLRVEPVPRPMPVAISVDEQGRPRRLAWVAFVSDPEPDRPLWYVTDLYDFKPE